MSANSDPDEIFIRFCFGATGFLALVLLALFAAPIPSAPEWWKHAISATIAIGMTIV